MRVFRLCSDRVSSHDRGRELRASAGARGWHSAVRFVDMVSDRRSQRDGRRLMAADSWLESVVHARRGPRARWWRCLVLSRSLVWKCKAHEWHSAAFVCLFEYGLLLHCLAIVKHRRSDRTERLNGATERSMSIALEENVLTRRTSSCGHVDTIVQIRT